MKNEKSFLNILIPVSLGELLDKMTILEIKKTHIKENEKLKNINKELEYLKKILLNAKYRQYLHALGGTDVFWRAAKTPK